MTTFETVLVAAVQATPVILDAEATVDKAVRRARRAHLVIGVNREDDRPGSLYNTMLTIGPRGVLHRHRKLMPTMQERLFHGVGAGDDLGVTDLPEVGRVGAGEGGAAIVEPRAGNVIAGPLRGEEGIVVADCDLRAGLHAKRWFDAVGHYSREEVLAAGDHETADGGIAGRAAPR